ncbi:MAG: CBS domain-containing protein [Pirellulales bacterium]|nr:CBS domain-containing protein [Pirellulales bacterium]
MSFLSLTTDRVTTAYPEQALPVAPSCTLGATLQLMKQHRTGAVLVCEDVPAADGVGTVSRIVGIFTERDALRCMADGASLEAPITDSMTPGPATISPAATVGQAIAKMAQHGFRHLPIVDEQGQPTGVTAVRGLVHYLVDHFPNTIYTLPPDPGKSPDEREGA